jgi:NAD(P)H-nitrite reductase large subunit
MWTIQKAEEIKEAAEESEEAVVIGGGLLGIDLAVAFAENDADTHYLIRGSNWWSRGLDEEGASIIHEKLEELGVNVVTDTEASEFVAEDGEVTKVVSKDGEEFSCDSVAIAIGQTPNSEIVDVEKTDGGLIQVDEQLQTSDEDIYAAGNMVEYYSPVFEERTVKGSWDHSDAMGERAGKNMIGEDEAFDYVNTYGVGHFKTQFLAIGDWTGEPVSKKYDDDHYRRLYFKENRLVGAVMIGYTIGQEQIKDMIKGKEKFEDKEALLEKSYWE